MATAKKTGSVYVVTAPLVITKKPDGSDLYLYENAPLPESVPDSEVERLINLGMIDAVDAASVPEPTAETN